MHNITYFMMTLECHSAHAYVTCRTP